MVPYIRRLPVLLGVCAVAVVIGDTFFADGDPGWVWAVFLLLLGLAIARHPVVLRHARGQWLVLATAVLTTALVIDPSWMAIALVLIGIVSAVQSGRGGTPVDALPWLGEQIGMLPRSALRMIPDVSLIVRWSARHGIHRRRWAWLGAWLIPVLFGGVFLFLFATANPIIDSWFARLAELVRDAFMILPAVPAISRVLVWCSVLIVAWAILRARRAKRRIPVASRPVSGRELVRLDHTPLILRCLALFNAVFAVQSALDVAYLWGSLALPPGLTYASYAHRSAYPLVATALLAALFVLVCFRPDGALQSLPSARRLVFAWLGQNVFLVVCALWRLHLYVDAYSLTLWRVTAVVWMALVACGVILIGWRISRGRSNRWLINANALTLAAMLGLLCFIDVRGLIAWHNVTRCREAGGSAAPIDLHYLEELGPAAAPALLWLAGHSHDAAVARASAGLAVWDGDSARRLLADWRAWTVVRAGIAQAAPPAKPPLDSPSDPGYLRE